jgi:uncharacterized repeat protein (TIGR01451 family)
VKFLLIAGVMILGVSLTPTSALAQEVGYIDLSDNIFRDDSRQTRTRGGGCGTSPHSAQDSQLDVTTTIMSLDKTRYRIGEEATFEIKVMNTGNKTILVPWTPHSGDLVPVNPHSSYKLSMGTISLVFEDPEGFNFLVAEYLFGLPNVPGSLRELPPGQWFIVKGRKSITPSSADWGKQEFADSGFVEAKVGALYMEDTRSYSPKDGGSLSDWCIPLRCRKSNQLEVTLERP